MAAVGIVLGFVLLLCYMFYRKRKKEITLFKNIGISGPEPNFLFGNLLEFRETHIHQKMQEWTKKYGSVYGMYEGPKPVLVVSDLELLRHVFIKQFGDFHSRKQFAIQADPDAKDEIHMFLARGERWRRLRTITNPTFTAAKMKQMCPIMNSCIDVFMDVLRSKYEARKPFDIYSVFQGLTLDVIGQVALGLQIDCQRNKSEQFLIKCRKVFQISHEKWIPLMLAAVFPELGVFWRYILKIYFIGETPPLDYITEKVQEVVSVRRKMKKPLRQDLLQLLMDTKDASEQDGEDKNEEINETKYLNVNGDSEETESTWATKRVRKRLSDEELRHQGQLFVLAAYETTSTMLGYIAQMLVVHNDVQVKLQQEIDNNIGADEPSYDQLHSVGYLDMVIDEVLRLYPAASMVNARENLHPVTVKGLVIPAGVTVQADVWSIHRNPEIWGENPDSFDPERFRPELKQTRDPMAFLSFGTGPRNCIGKRFALMEIKFAIVKLLQKYTLVRCSQTQDPLELCEGATITPKDGVFVELKER